MFKGKIYYYSNVNGKEQRVEKEFDDPQEFEKFADALGLANVNYSLPDFNDWFKFNDYLENFIEKKLGWYSNKNKENKKTAKALPVDLSKYEKQLEDLNKEKEQKKEKIEEIKSAISKLKDYKKQFKDLGKTDTVKEIEADISKLEKELAKIQK